MSHDGWLSLAVGERCRRRPPSRRRVHRASTLLCPMGRALTRPSSAAGHPVLGMSAVHPSSDGRCDWAHHRALDAQELQLVAHGAPIQRGVGAPARAPCSRPRRACAPASSTTCSRSPSRCPSRSRRRRRRRHLREAASGGCARESVYSIRHERSRQNPSEGQLNAPPPAPPPPRRPHAIGTANSFVTALSVCLEFACARAVPK